MKKYLILLTIFLLNVSFALDDAPKIQSYKSLSSGFSEDAYILEALDAIDAKDDKKALEKYKILYQNTKKIEYLKEQIFALMRLEDYDSALKTIKEFEAIIPNDLEILKAKAYIVRQDTEAAIGIWQRIIQLEDNVFNNNFIAALYYAKNDFENARAHLLRAYKIENNEEMILVLASLDLEEKKFDNSVALIKAHFKDEMSERFASLLIPIARKLNALDSLEPLFLYYLNKKPSNLNATNLAKLYYEKKDYAKVLELAKKYEFDAYVLIDIYMAQKDYAKAKAEAQKAYSRTKEDYYLGIMAIIDFESAGDAEGKRKIAPQIVDMLKKAVKNTPNHIFYNYVGYLMIDYDINIAEGVDFVQKALRVAPENPAYLDSLAWGHFKSGKCGEAKAVMDKIPREVVQKESEIREHLEAIDKCLGN